MPIRARKEGTKVAVYTVPSLVSTDDAPLSDPIANLSRVLFHSDLDYLAVNSIVTGTLSLPSRSGTTPGTFRHNLFAHGLGYQPLVLGHLVNFEGYNTPLMGTTPIRMASDRSAFGAVDMRTLQLGVDATYVYVHEYVMLINVSVTMPAVSLDWRVLVTTRNLDLTTGNDNTISDANHARITGSRAILGKGKFDSNRKHLKKVASGGFPVVVGPSFKIQQAASPDWAINFKYSVNGQARSSYFGSTITVSNSVVAMDAV